MVYIRTYHGAYLSLVWRIKVYILVYLCSS